MIRRLVTLTERRGHPVRLRRDDVDFLLAHARRFIDIAPAFERGLYRLTPRGVVGFLDSPTTRYLIQPKIPWPNLAMLLGFAAQPGGEVARPEDGLLAVLADEFACRLTALSRAGLVAGYGVEQGVSPFLKGKLLTAEQLRQAAAGSGGDIFFHVEEQVFDLHTPWNRIPKATASLLLSRGDLPDSVRERVGVAVRALAAVPDEPARESDFQAAAAEPRVQSYQPLLDVCRLIINGFACADPLGADAGAFLVDLGRAFERYLVTSLRREFAAEPGWSLEAHAPFTIGPTELQPDIVIRRDGAPHAVLDAKWKSSSHEAADLHQILAYATIAGASRVGLVYPGQHDDRTAFLTPGNRVLVTLYRLRVVGTQAQLAASAAKLARRVRKE